MNDCHWQPRGSKRKGTGSDAMSKREGWLFVLAFTVVFWVALAGVLL